MKITDVTVKRYSASRERPDATGIQIVEVHTDGGVTGTGFVCTPSSRHRVHHGDPAFDTSTGIRFHPLESLFSTALKIALVVMFGASAGVL